MHRKTDSVVQNEYENSATLKDFFYAVSACLIILVLCYSFMYIIHLYFSFPQNNIFRFAAILWSFISVLIIICLMIIGRKEINKVKNHSRIEDSDTGNLRKPIHNYACRMCNFQNLWFIILLIGFFTSITSNISELGEGFTSFIKFDFLSAVVKEFLISAFIATITAVLSNSLIFFSKSGEHQSGIISDLKQINYKINDFINETKPLIILPNQLNEQVDQFKDQFNKITESTKNLQKGMALTEIVYAIDTGCNNLPAGETFKNYINCFNNLKKNLFKFYERLFFALILDINETVDDNNKVTNIARALSADIPKKDDHLAYMGAVISKNLEMETRERSIPGVMINLNSFTTYVQTIQEIVESLSIKKGELEFYTLMPDNPLRIFQYRNNSDEFDDWIKFLIFYQNSRINSNVTWQRIFPYVENGNAKEPFILPDQEDIFDNEQTIKALLNNENPYYLYTGTNQCWIPKKISIKDLTEVSTQKIKNVKKDEFDKCNYKKIIAENKYGTIVAAKEWFSNDAYKTEWISIEEALKMYHGNKEDSLKFLCAEQGIINLFNSSKKWEFHGKDSSNREITRSVKVPRDLFAIAKKGEGAQEKEWLLVIGQDYSYDSSETRNIGREAITTVVDLKKLSLSKQEENITTCGAIIELLNNVFIYGDSKTKNEFLESNQVS